MKNLINFTRGVPPAESFPKEELIKCAREVIIAQGAQVLQYGSAAGYEPLREFLAQQNDADIDQVVIGQGSLQLLDILCRISLEDGDSVFVEQPTYDRTITIFKRANANLSGFKLITGQLDIKEIEAALMKGIVPKYFYVIADFQNPSGSVMGIEQRYALIELARQYGFLIIEDSPYRHLRYEGDMLPALFDISPDTVIQMSSFSKLACPGLRTGTMILPKSLAKNLSKYAENSYISPSLFNQAIVFEFIKQGMLEKQTDYLIDLYRPRLSTILSAMDIYLAEFGEWEKPQGGFFVGLTLNGGITSPTKETAESFGLALSDGCGFFLNGGSHFIRLPFCALTESELEAGIQRLADAISASK